MVTPYYGFFNILESLVGFIQNFQKEQEAHLKTKQVSYVLRPFRSRTISSFELDLVTNFFLSNRLDNTKIRDLMEAL